MGISGKKIVLCVTGSIAAYKTPELTRQLVKKGAEVKIICTPSATKFVSTLALSTVSKNEVLSELSEGASWNNHVHLGLWADVLLVAPCSAHTLAKIVLGLCDNLLQAVYLSAKCPVLLAPAMDEDMWLHPATQANIQRAQSFGHQIIPVGHGELASGLVGAGRMAEIIDIVQYLEDFFSAAKQLPLKGKKALVTAGPTFERIDPVRYIGNFSTGKMGIALAEELQRQGAEVHLVLGPTHLSSSISTIKITRVESAIQMLEVCKTHFPDVDICIMAAAVADYRSRTYATDKIKKSEEALILTLDKNPDILAHLGTIKKENQTLVGFALETNNEEDHARQKLKNKNADYIVLNSLQDAGAGFGVDTNKVTILGKDGSLVHLALQSKVDTAKDIIQHIISSD